MRVQMLNLGNGGCVYVQMDNTSFGVDGIMLSE